MTATESVELPDDLDLLAGHPVTAYFWGRVAGDGDVRDDRLSVTTGDEGVAETLARIAGAGVGGSSEGDAGAAGNDDATLERTTTTREYAHDASITRTEDEFTVTVTDDSLFGRSGALGLPVDGRGSYRFEAFRAHDRELLRGLLEGCGTICFKSSSASVGVSFVHDDRALLETVRDLLADCPVPAPAGDLSETSSGGYWFGIDDEAVPAFGEWLYADCEGASPSDSRSAGELRLYAPGRVRKLRRSLEQVRNLDRASDSESRSE